MAGANRSPGITNPVGSALHHPGECLHLVQIAIGAESILSRQPIGKHAHG
jgi:hypothetical protein